MKTQGANLSPETVTVIGGGIAGITAAHELAVAGHEVTLVEASERLGGLGTYFDWEGRPIDKFYHCQMPSDDDLLQLIEDIGAKDEMYWKKTRMGFLVDGARYAFNGALDLLKFKPLTFVERLRFGIVSLLLRPLGKGKDLDNIRIEDWLSSIYGKSIWKKLLKPLFVSKFGPAAGDMPALYIWARLGREKNTASRGYLNGGLKYFLDTAEAKLRELGVEIIKSASVVQIDEVGSETIVTLKDQSKISSAWCISTMPLPLLKNVIADSVLEDKVRIPDVEYQGVVNAMFFLKRPLDNYYWAPVMGCNTEFDGIVEMTELIDIEHYNNHHCAYVMKYCDRSSDLFAEDETTIAIRWKRQLIDLYPDLRLTTADIADVKIFKAPFVEPAYPLGYSKLKPAINENGNRLFLATSSQVYPRITAWNSSCWMAKQVVAELCGRIAEEQKATPTTSSMAAIR